MWAAAATAVGNVSDHAKVVQELQNMSYKGLTGTLKFDETRKIPTSDATQPAYLLQVQGGKLTPLMIGTKKVGEFIEPPFAK